MNTDGNLVKSPSPPLNRPHTDTEHHQEVFAAISAKTPVDEEFRAAFVRSKLRIAYTHPASTLRRATRQLLVWSIVWARRRRRWSPSHAPAASARASSITRPSRRVGVSAHRSAVILCARSRLAATPTHFFT